MYLLRFDDLCPTMNWDIWMALEAMLLEFSIRPMLAVVPSNQDPDLVAGPPHPNFWGEVRKWQERGWTIALHGHEHLPLTRRAGMVGIARRSEFAGLSYEVQAAKLQRGLEIFSREQVKANLWIAPSHSFDMTTVRALKTVGFRTISDGFALAPYRDPEGMLWVPQQLWKFRWRPAGVWTVCSHHNHWTAHDIADFRRSLQKYRESITDLPSVVARYSTRPRHLLDDVYAHAHLGALALRRQFAGAA